MQGKFPKRALLFCLALSLCACTLVVDDPNGPAQSTTPVATGTTAPLYTPPERPDAQAAADAALDALPEMDFGGATLLIAMADETAGSVLFPAAGELEEDKARLLRNAAVTERYGVKFIPSSAPVDTIYQETLAASNAGLYYADLLLLPAEQVGRFATAGLLRNLRNLPFWSNSPAGETALVNDAVYADLGEAVKNHSSLPAVYFNRAMAESLGFDFYADVDAGAWTWERYFAAAAAAATLDGKAGHALVPTDPARYADLCVASSGVTMVANPLGQAPTMTQDTASIELLDGLLRRLREAAFPARAENPIAALQAFTVDGILLCTGDLAYIDWIYDASTAWGILPLPSIDGETYTPAGAAAPTLCVTANNNKFELTGLTLTALNAASTDVITEAFITQRLRNSLRDWQSAGMIERIADNVCYDFVTLYGAVLSNAVAATRTAQRNAAAGGASFVSVFNTYRAAANGDLARVFGN